MALYRLGQEAPRIAASAWIADSAQVIGNVDIGDDVGIWFGAVLRADTEPIRIGRGSNVQDGAVVHADPGFPATVGEDVTVGHQAMLHGCMVGDGTLIGIQAVLLNGSRVGRHCLVGAGALLPEGREYPGGSLILGRPAKVVRALSAAEIAGLDRAARHYVENAQRFAATLARIDA
jgi:carbonic anhydrase/acetyltransferase-like protein (isoleucine patch superfamily)